ncbi:MAG: glutamate racemase [Solirubrobacteraceae bacterium]|jgi:glutamate racemase|nr:glutamate racemase [Solirubrobacteraceae bacterium]
MSAQSPDAATRPIGVFDSGVGGLTVLHELLVQLPHEDFVYLADTARFPYGPRGPEELQRFSLEIAEELLARRVKLLVVACNSASAAALPALQERMMQTTLGVDVIGVVAPAAVHAVAASRNGRVGLLATDVTVRSGAYPRVIAAIDPHVQLTSVPCHDLAEAIQRGFPMNEELVETVRGYCAPLREAGVDTVVLGSTHYPLVRPMIQRVLGRGVELIASGVPVSRQVDHVLGSRGLASPREGEGDYRFLCTGDPARFSELGTRFLQMPLHEVEPVDLAARAGVTG